MMQTLDDIQDEVLDYLGAELPVKIVDTGIPDIDSVERTDDGQLVPYIAVQFGDIMAVGSRSFHGPQGDDYQMPIYLQVVHSDPRQGRRLANAVTGKLLGADFTHAGSVRKRVAGAQFPMENTQGGVEAYIFPLSFGLLIQAFLD